MDCFYCNKNNLLHKVKMIIVTDSANHQHAMCMECLKKELDKSLSVCYNDIGPMV